jgi:hypothetical protein
VLLVLAVIATLGGAAHARRPMQQPRLVRECPTAASWSVLLDCFKLHRLAGTIVASVDDAKLISVAVADATHYSEGLAVYVRSGESGPWHLGGLLGDGAEAGVELLHFEHVGRNAYRIDRTEMIESSISLDGATSVPALYRDLSTAFCSGTSYRCIQVVSHCEQIVHGQAVMAYAGTLTVHDNTLSLKGAGSQPSCGADVEASF